MAQAQPDPKVPLLDKDVVSLSACPICGSQRYAAFHKMAFGDFLIRHHRCRDCGLVFMSPVPTQEWYGRYYAHAFWEGKTSPGKMLGPSRIKAKQQAEKYLLILSGVLNGKSPATMLEVGAADCMVAEHMSHALDATAFAIEPSIHARALAQEHTSVELVGETAEDLADWTPPKPLDLVLFSYSLENIVDTSGTLALVRERMAPGSLLMIETANIDWAPSMSIYHPHCFSSASLRALAYRHGFEVAHESASPKPPREKWVPR